METFSALLAICAENSKVTGEFSEQWPVTCSFDVLSYLRLNKRLSKQWWGWWLKTPSCPLWLHCNVLLSTHLSWVKTVCDAELWCFLSASEQTVDGKQSRRRWFETPWRSFWRHCNGCHKNNILDETPHVFTAQFIAWLLKESIIKSTSNCAVELFIHIPTSTVVYVSRRLGKSRHDYLYPCPIPIMQTWIVWNFILMLSFIDVMFIFQWFCNVG